jgi:hypothetical protein
MTHKEQVIKKALDDPILSYIRASKEQLENLKDYKPCEILIEELLPAFERIKEKRLKELYSEYIKEID